MPGQAGVCYPPSVVWVDCDPAIGLPFADVDDGLALLWLAASDVELAGISTCFGNASLDRVHAVAQDLGRRMGVAVARGASGPGQVASEAVDALVAFSGTVLAIGPVTNIAAALERGASWERLVVLGGYEGGGPNIRPWRTRELNFALDEDAAELVLARGCDLVPMEPCYAAWFGAAELAALPADLARACRSWLWSSPLRTGRLAFHPWDLVGAAWITDPDLVDSVDVGATLVRGPLIRGTVRRVRGPGRLLTTLRADALARRFVARVSRWGQGATDDHKG